jgi:SlyX protein
MNPDDDIALQIRDLESRLAWQDDTLDKLNAVIREQWEQIDQNRQRLEALEERIRELELEDGGPAITPPPHY